MFRFACLCVVLVAVTAQYVEEKYAPPQPYSYSYETELEGGRSTRSESTDGSGLVIGSYSIIDDDGRQRIVEYTAGPDGFQANIKTNEPGTKQEASAGVQIEANPIDVPASGAINYARAPAPAIAIRPQPRPITYINAPQPQILPLGAQQGGSSRYVLVPADSLQGLRGIQGLSGLQSLRGLRTIRQ